MMFAKLSLLLLSAALAACGQPGPLYLPKKPVTVKVEPPPPTPPKPAKEK